MMRRLLPASLALLCLLAGCARSTPLLKWESDFYYAERLHDDGQHDAARAQFAALRQAAKDPRDADEAGLMACETQARASAFAQAAACYDALAVDANDPDVRARAFMHAAELRMYELGQSPTAQRMFVLLIRQAPAAAATQRALDHLYLLGLHDAKARPGILATLRSLEAQAPESEIADNLLLRIAMLDDAVGTTASREDGIVVLTRLEKQHPEAQTIIDGMMLHARLARDLGHFKEEALELERVVGTYETSYNFASYVLSEHTIASLRLMELYRGPLLDLDRAEWHAHHLPAMLRTPLKMSQFMLELAEIQEQHGELRRALDTCLAVLRYVHDRNEDFAEDDRRICREMEEKSKRDACLQDLSTRVPVEEGAVRIARESIERLQTALRSPPPRGGKR